MGVGRVSDGGPVKRDAAEGRGSSSILASQLRRVWGFAVSLLFALLPTVFVSSDAGSGQRRNTDLLMREYLAVVREYCAGDLDGARLTISQWHQKEVLSVVSHVARVRRRLPRTGYQPDLSGWNVRMLAASTLFNIELAAVQDTPLYQRAFHLSVARHFLGTLVPANDLAEAELLSRAIAAVLQLELKVEDLNEYLPWAVGRFPKSAELLLSLGSLHELASAQRLASAREEYLIPSDTAASIRKAEAAYSRALALDPQLTNARLRLARVLHLQGRQNDARAEVKTVLATGPEWEQEYLAWLFLGAVEEGAKEWTAALRAYERAAAVCISCQTPKFGLARAYAAVGQLDAVSDVIHDALQQAAVHTRGDPWTLYDYGQGRRLPALVRELRGSLCAAN